MTDRTALAYSRLSILVVLAGLLAILACRPAWSPDGKKLLYPALTGPRHISIALYDRDTGKASLLGETPSDNNLVAMVWSPDGKTAVIVASNQKDKSLSIAAHAVPATGKPRRFEIASKTNVSDAFVAPPVVVGRHLFLSVDGIARLDLASGDVKRRDAADGHTLVVFARGSGLGYLSIPKGEKEAEWELGTVDPATLELATLFVAPKNRAWEAMPMPAFTSDLSRIAIPARMGDGKEAEHAILVFRDARLETVLPIGKGHEVGIGSVDWANDDVSLLIGLCRRGEGERPEAWGLYETSISGSVTRETTLVRSVRSKDNDVMGIMFPMALSPDGKTAAFSTAMIEHVEEGDAGLYLVDLTSKERKVTRVLFPKRED